jgi:hypothetical protein
MLLPRCRCSYFSVPVSWQQRSLLTQTPRSRRSSLHCPLERKYLLAISRKKVKAKPYATHSEDTKTFRILKYRSYNFLTLEELLLLHPVFFLEW